MSEKIEIIDNTQDMECYNCLGTGYPMKAGQTRKQATQRKCPTCKGTGIWKEQHYYLICHDRKIAFDIDSAGK